MAEQQQYLTFNLNKGLCPYPNRKENARERFPATKEIVHKVFGKAKELDTVATISLKDSPVRTW
jgi:hypothetical protein